MFNNKLTYFRNKTHESSLSVPTNMQVTKETLDLHYIAQNKSPYKDDKHKLKTINTSYMKASEQTLSYLKYVYRTPLKFL